MTAATCHVFLPGHRVRLEISSSNFPRFDRNLNTGEDQGTSSRRLPVWASCWGPQLATVALGGTVRRNPRGRELGVARAITATPPGRSHPLLATRPPVFDALCSHIDELEQLPPGAVVLSQNELCSIQALTAELPSGSLLFGTQYHPEFTLAVAAGLIEMRAASLVAEGFGRDCAELVAMARDFRALHAEPERRDLAWRYGIGSEILDPVRRTAEIGNWLRETGKISSS
jgi:GMP synthase (glutamine-hydrolysing)